MSGFVQFLSTFGAVLMLMSIVAAWLFRTASVALVWRLIFPLLIVVMTVWAPFKVRQMMGRPIVTSTRFMPREIDLIQFLPRDEIKSVDLWVVSGAEREPVVYEVPLTKGMQKVLTQAREPLAKGQKVTLELSDDGAVSGNDDDDEADAGKNGHHKRVGNHYLTGLGGGAAPDYKMKVGGTKVMPAKDVASPATEHAVE